MTPSLHHVISPNLVDISVCLFVAVTDCSILMQY